MGAFDWDNYWNDYFKTIGRTGLWYADRMLTELMSYLTELFFDSDNTEGLYKSADGRARESLERFMDPESRAKVNVMMAI